MSSSALRTFSLRESSAAARAHRVSVVDVREEEEDDEDEVAELERDEEERPEYGLDARQVPIDAAEAGDAHDEREEKACQIDENSSSWVPKTCSKAMAEAPRKMRKKVKTDLRLRPAWLRAEPVR